MSDRSSCLNPTRPEHLTDAAGRPYFLWDVDIPLAAFRERLRDPDPDVSGYWSAKLLRQARPDDVFLFLTLSDLERRWPYLCRHLGKSRAFWTWLLQSYGRHVR